MFGEGCRNSATKTVQSALILEMCCPFFQAPTIGQQSASCGFSCVSQKVGQLSPNFLSRDFMHSGIPSGFGVQFPFLYWCGNFPLHITHNTVQSIYIHFILNYFLYALIITVVIVENVHIASNDLSFCMFWSCVMFSFVSESSEPSLLYMWICYRVCYSISYLSSAAAV